jgi:hypothetical protein
VVGAHVVAITRRLPTGGFNELRKHVICRFLLCSSHRCAARLEQWITKWATSIICDTQTQVERFVALFSGDTQVAIDAVNAEEQNPTACALVDVAYLRGAEIGMARNGDSVFEIVRILVVGIDTAAGIQAVRPSTHFSLFGVKEYAV